MARTVCWMLLALLAASARAQPAAEPAAPALPDLSALIAHAEPAVACILVSRSPLYKKFGLAPRLPRPGVLGGYGPPERERARAAAGFVFGQVPHDEGDLKALNARL